MANQANYDANNNSNDNDHDNDKRPGGAPSAADHVGESIKRVENDDRQEQRRRVDVSGPAMAAAATVIVSEKSRANNANAGVGREKCDKKCVLSDEAKGILEVGAIGEKETNRPDDQWHLLDVDGQSVAASTASSLNELELTSSEPPSHAADDELRQRRRSSSRLQARQADDKMARLHNHSGAGGANTKHTKLDDRQQDEVRASGGGELSPVLVRTCTVLYALMPVASFFAFILLMWLLFTSYWPVTVAYYTYLLLDSKTCNRGGRRVEAVYESRFWTYLAAHFPIQLRYSKHFKLDPSENYILNYHPHGIAAFGCVSAFATNALNFKRLFPGITSRFMVHETSFLVPLMRETFSLRGDCSVNSKSFDYILSKKWKQPKEEEEAPTQVAGNLLALCGGGLAEADLSDMECLKIVVATRKGFVKKALIHGANLIPCIAFGENSVFTKVNLKPGSFFHKLENRFYSLFKFRHPIYYGTSVLGNEKRNGIMPYKRPITVIMGDPIMVARVEQPSQEQIDQLHSKYIECLKVIYEDNRHLCTEFDLKMELV